MGEMIGDSAIPQDEMFHPIHSDQYFLVKMSFATWFLLRDK
jgi:hypothetical protein